jgi:hypothetical protein
MRALENVGNPDTRTSSEKRIDNMIKENEKINKKNGHPRFYEILDEFADLHSRKNHDYASGGDPLGNFRRVAKIFSMYPGLKLSDPLVVALCYAMKQVDASLWMLSNGHKAEVEGVVDRLQDVSVYAAIGIILAEVAAKEIPNDCKPDALEQADV